MASKKLLIFALVIVLGVLATNVVFHNSGDGSIASKVYTKSCGRDLTTFEKVANFLSFDRYMPLVKDKAFFCNYDGIQWTIQVMEDWVTYKVDNLLNYPWKGTTPEPKNDALSRMHEFVNVAKDKLFEMGGRKMKEFLQYVEEYMFTPPFKNQKKVETSYISSTWSFVKSTGEAVYHPYFFWMSLPWILNFTIFYIEDPFTKLEIDLRRQRQMMKRKIKKRRKKREENRPSEDDSSEEEVTAIAAVAKDGYTPNVKLNYRRRLQYENVMMGKTAKEALTDLCNRGWKRYFDDDKLEHLWWAFATINGYRCKGRNEHYTLPHLHIQMNDRFKKGYEERTILPRDWCSPIFFEGVFSSSSSDTEVYSTGSLTSIISPWTDDEQ